MSIGSYTRSVLGKKRAWHCNPPVTGQNPACSGRNVFTAPNRERDGVECAKRSEASSGQVHLVSSMGMREAQHLVARSSIAIPR